MQGTRTQAEKGGALNLHPDGVKPQETVIKQRVMRIDRLSAVPQVVWKLIDALGDDRTIASDLEKIIEGDMALTSKVLSLANSAFYGARQKATTIHRAVIVIGFHELRLLAVGLGLAQVFNLKDAPERLDGEGLWLHSLAVGWMAGELAENIRYSLPAEIQIAGLLHDLGKLVCAVHFRDETERVFDLVEQGMPYHQAEEEVGIPHTSIGYWLAVRWDLPKVHCAAIRDHHGPRAEDPYVLSTSLVFLANRLVKELGFGVIHESAPSDPAWAMGKPG